MDQHLKARPYHYASLKRAESMLERFQTFTEPLLKEKRLSKKEDYKGDI